MSASRWFRVLAVLAVLGLLGVPRPAGSAQAPPQDVLIFGATSDVETMDPQVSVDNIAWRAIYYCYDRLVQLKGGTTEVAPQLAESWTVSPDGKTFTFRLRSGVKFIDGTPFDAQAVAASFGRLFKMGKGAAGLWDGILDPGGITVVNPSTIRFTLKTPFAPFLGSLATDQASIVSPGVMKHETAGDLGQAWLAGHTAGTGPFYLKEWRRGERIVLERNPNYWGPKPALRQVIIRNIPDAAVLRDLLERGEVDMGEVLTDDQIDAIKDKPGIRVFEAPSFLATYIYLNNRNRYLENVKVRQAISYAIDYQGIIRGVRKGRAVQMRGPIPQGMAGHDKTVFQYTRDVARARRLLAEAGHPQGFELGLLIDPGVREWADIATIVQANLAEIGIRVKIEGYARPTMRAKLDKADFDMATGFWTPDYPDADMFTWFWFYSKNGGLAGNRSFYSNPRMDELVVAQRQEPDPAKRMQLFRQIQKIAVDDAVYVYLYQPVYRIAMRSRVQGYVYNPMLLFMPNFSGISKAP
ncbi:MAG: ABC transporter substrate-binding protein [Armatimonadota bacterium]|nr:ABC transporter substrate-binding protein [Armatimonadota bacterium]MDR7467737.1 ABC transporter substrate-binding protein [Armatimonadota bacterium]MDR7494937.1 ABC transporter substrate-binding protein [Armatimonadota bacterium]MDR7499798.1 ABC transporter substrate-binding protein [Armatimonadota bacterium]MDR7505256.1 ABC transporter substrate-binding protein [Armatimonadota bacterium]